MAETRTWLMLPPPTDAGWLSVPYDLERLEALYRRVRADHGIDEYHTEAEARLITEDDWFSAVEGQADWFPRIADDAAPRIVDLPHDLDVGTPIDVERVIRVQVAWTYSLDGVSRSTHPVTPDQVLAFMVAASQTPADLAHAFEVLIRRPHILRRLLQRSDTPSRGRLDQWMLQALTDRFGDRIPTEAAAVLLDHEDRALREAAITRLTGHGPEEKSGRSR